MTETDLQALVEDAGMEIDEGCTVGGPFIDDGVVRIYNPETLEVIGEGPSLESAYLSCSELLSYA
jgi:hypothetical protein